MHKAFILFLFLWSSAAFAAAPPARLAGDSLPLVPAAARGNIHGRASVIVRIVIGVDGNVEKTSVVRAPVAPMGSFIADYVKQHWRFAPPHDAAGKASKADYLQPFNYDFSGAVAESNAASAAPAEPEPTEKKSLIVRNGEEAANDDALPSPDMPTAGAMRGGKSQKVQIDPRVLKVLTDSEPQFRSCGDEKATVRTSFVINESGAVARAHVRSSTLDDEDFERCVLDTLSKLVFPKPRGGGPVLVLYPVVLQ
jgi:Gram-negative bacterial TonB protein C-terminal